MSYSTKKLPNFEHPPVVEVAISLQFQKCQGLRSIQMASLLPRFSQFTKSEEHPQLEPVIEQLEPGPVRPTMQFEISNVPPTPRFFFLNDPGTELIQIQQDRFGHNWRKIGSQENYPRYEVIKTQFNENLETFCSYLNEQKLGKFVPKQCEITYVNHIEAGNGWNEFSEIGQVFTTQQANYSDDFLNHSETVSFSETHIIRNGEAPIGRLRINVEPAYLTGTSKKVFKMVLVARGAPLSADISGVLNFLDIGREWVVRGFTSITQESMHKIWGRKE